MKGKSNTFNISNTSNNENSKFAITINNLVKQYDDFKLNHINFQVPKGSIMGFVGENGAGKTTTMKAILDLITIDEGEITILGSDSRNLPKEKKALIGVVLDGSNLHDNLNVNNINLIMQRIYLNWEERIFYEYIKRFNLPETKILKEYSRGMKMKLSIVIALSHHAKLLILDEATSGLDPMVREEILDIFLEFMQDEEHTILFSSHIISDIEKIADYVTFIHKGNIVFSKNKDDLIYQHGLIHCKKDEVNQIDKAYIVGVRENRYGAEVLIKNKALFQRQYNNFKVDRTTIEEIMLFITRGKESF
ncbi:MAG: ABC transporter ATP-binding protein [Clostridiales bacterium]|nr:ABC transporter ATP-binding protein [Clostridiales bacterium]